MVVRFACRRFHVVKHKSELLVGSQALNGFGISMHAFKHEGEALVGLQALSWSGISTVVRKVSDGRPQEQHDQNFSLEGSVPHSSEDLSLDQAMWIQISDGMELSGMQKDRTMLASLLRMCGNTTSLLQGKHVHSQLVETGLEGHPSIKRLLVQMYAKCRAVDDAMEIFVNMHQPSVVLWNLMITVYLREGQGKEALLLFDGMQQKGVMTTKVTYICMLSACASQEDLVSGKMMHARVVMSKFKADIVLCTSLLNMYGNCGSLKDACRVFNNIEDRDVIAWNAMLAVYLQHGLDKESFILFGQMQVEGVMPNKVTFISILDACARLKDLAEGKRMHRFIMDSGLILDVVTGTAVISMHGKCGSLEEALFMFENLPIRDIVVWNAMIALYAQHSQCTHAFQLFDRMLHEGFIPTKITYISIFNVCASQAAVSAGEWVHACLVYSRLETDLDVGNAIVNMYGKFGRLANAQQMFQRMPERDVVTWSAMIAAYGQHGQGRQALQAFLAMQQEGVTPNEVTLINILHAFEAEADLNEVKQLHDYVLSHGFNRNMMVGTALVNMYGKFGSLKDARMVFDELPERDVLCWTAIISAYVQHRQGREALFLFDQMQKEGLIPDKVAIINILAACSGLVSLTECEQMHACIQQYGLEPDEVVGSAIISMYGRFGRLNLAQMLFDELPKKHTTTWNAMIVAYVQHGQCKNALRLFDQMCFTGVMPDKDTFVSTLAACASEAALVDGEKVYAFICKSGFVLNNVVAGALVSMYGKCGCLEVSQSVFDNTQKHDVILWNAMVGVHAQHGEVCRALQLVDHMQGQGFMLDTVTLISVLNACSHAGLLDEGCWYIASMEHAFNILPAIDHYVCVIDLLRRSGQLDEAESWINHMPFQPKAVSYMSLLGAWQSLADVEQGVHAAKHMSELDPENAGPYVSLSNIYAAAIREQGCSGGIRFGNNEFDEAVLLDPLTTLECKV